MKFDPLYAVCYRGQEIHAFVAILTIRILWIRVGLVEKGPVGLGADNRVDAQALEALQRWARSMDLAFLRFVCQPELGEGLLAAGGIKDDLFPLYGGVNMWEMLVPLQEDASAMLSAFGSNARYKIRTAEKLGYTLRRSEEPEDLLHNWGLLENMASRKGIKFRRPAKAWMEVLRGGAPLNRASLYLADYHQKTVEVILVVHDAVVAEYMLGAMAIESVNKKASPSHLLHWTAMRDAVRLGRKYYDLGAPGGQVVEFKRRFRPQERSTLAYFTLPCRPLSCWLWSKVLLRMVFPMWPAVKRLISAVLRSDALSETSRLGRLVH